MAPNSGYPDMKAAWAAIHAHGLKESIFQQCYRMHATGVRHSTHFQHANQ